MAINDSPDGTQQGDGTGEITVSPAAAEIAAGDGRAWF